MTNEKLSGSTLELGSDHRLQFFAWSPDDLEENRLTYGIAPGDPMPRVERAGATIWHRRPGQPADDDAWCSGAVTFDQPGLPASFSGPRWTVESWEPLTISPSVLCKVCGDHGVIRDGQWHAA